MPKEFPARSFAAARKKAREAGRHRGRAYGERQKFGLVVIGFVDPRKMLSKGGLKVGDALVLTKPLGFGVTTTALKREQVDANDLQEAVDWMKRLNKSDTSQLAVEFGLRGVERTSRL
ncbi:MAG: AIR synthase-related protein [Anaerolineales bacterium]